MTEKKNIFLVGPMGAGKSTIGRKLAKLLHMDFYDSDIEIEKRTGADISWVFDIEGELGFRLREKKIILELTKKNGIVLATGGGSVLSYTSRKRLVSNGIVIYLKTSIKKQLIRTHYDNKRPLLTSNLNESRKKILEKLSSLRNPLYESIADFIILTDQDSTKSIVNKILKKIGCLS